jgi:hypothetical protein
MTRVKASNVTDSVEGEVVAKHESSTAESVTTATSMSEPLSESSAEDDQTAHHDVEAKGHDDLATKSPQQTTEPEVPSPKTPKQKKLGGAENELFSLLNNSIMSLPPPRSPRKKSSRHGRAISEGSKNPNSFRTSASRPARTQRNSSAESPSPPSKDSNTETLESPKSKAPTTESKRQGSSSRHRGSSRNDAGNDATSEAKEKASRSRRSKSLPRKSISSSRHALHNKSHVRDDESNATQLSPRKMRTSVGSHHNYRQDSSSSKHSSSSNRRSSNGETHDKRGHGSNPSKRDQSSSHRRRSSSASRFQERGRASPSSLESPRSDDSLTREQEYAKSPNSTESNNRKHKATASGIAKEIVEVTKGTADATKDAAYSLTDGTKQDSDSNEPPLEGDAPNEASLPPSSSTGSTTGGIPDATRKRRSRGSNSKEGLPPTSTERSRSAIISEADQEKQSSSRSRRPTGTGQSRGSVSSSRQSARSDARQQETKTTGCTSLRERRERRYRSNGANSTQRNGTTTSEVGTSRHSTSMESLCLSPAGSRRSSLPSSPPGRQSSCSPRVPVPVGQRREHRSASLSPERCRKEEISKISLSPLFTRSRRESDEIHAKPSERDDEWLEARSSRQDDILLFAKRTQDNTAGTGSRGTVEGQPSSGRSTSDSSEAQVEGGKDKAGKKSDGAKRKTILTEVGKMARVSLGVTALGAREAINAVIHPKKEMEKVVRLTKKTAKKTARAASTPTQTANKMAEISRMISKGVMNYSTEVTRGNFELTRDTVKGTVGMVTGFVNELGAEGEARPGIRKEEYSSEELSSRNIAVPLVDRVATVVDSSPKTKSAQLEAIRWEREKRKVSKGMPCRMPSRLVEGKTGMSTTSWDP